MAQTPPLATYNPAAKIRKINVSAGFQLDDKYSTPSVPMNRVAVRNNLLIGVDNPNIVGGGYGFLIQGNIPSLSIEHNTVFVPTTSSLQWIGLGSPDTPA